MAAPVLLGEDGTEPARASARQVRQALTWVAALHGGDADRAAAARAQSKAWREQDPRHDAAWREAERRWAAVHQATAGEPALRMALPANAPRVDVSRRRWLAAAGSSGAALLVAGWSWHLWRAPLAALELATGRGEHLPEAALPDGSRVWLAADTRIAVSLWRQRRELRLEHGRVHLDVAHDGSRPFVVTTRLARIEVLGTAFTVSDRGAGIEVHVERGRVRVDGGGARALLGAGEAVRVAEADPMQALPADAAGALGHAAAAWRHGWWRFVDAPLAEALAEVNAYLPQPVAVSPRAGALRLTGSFPIDRPEAFVDALPRVLSVRVQTDPGGARRIEAASDTRR